MKKRCVLFLLLFVVFCGCACGKKEPTIKLITEYNGTTVDLCEPEVRMYLEATTEAEQIQALEGNTGNVYDHQNLEFQWENDGSHTYTLFIADNEEFEDAFEYETDQTELTDIGALIPGKTYYWKVVGDVKGSTSKVDTFHTLDAPVRFITTARIPNVRDMGGWQTEQGKRVKYGVIYRGGKTNIKGNSCDEFDAGLFSNMLGVRTELDLRSSNPSDDGGQDISVFGADVLYAKTPISGYTYIIPGFEQTAPIKRAFDKDYTYMIKSIFDILGDEENYPLMFHCTAGADRTGAVAFLINGVLGVSYEDLTRDFELTSFSVSGKRYRSRIENGAFTEDGIMKDDMDNYVAWGKLYQMMMEDYGTEDGTLASAIENYLITACKVKKQDIDTLREVMLED